ncbi:MAG: hypothetical protein IT449_09725 [Phycisphaerales bacterium]|nr:hypothetical protein [Phycisphaerales bacterium]
MTLRKLIPSVVGAALIVASVVTAVYWTQFRFYVPPDSCAVLKRKTGTELPPGVSIATQPGEKGLREHVLGPGRYFRNPWDWDWTLVPLTVVPAGNPAKWEWVHSLDESQRARIKAGDFKFQGEYPQVGVVTRKIGKEPRGGQTLVDRASGEKGVWREVLTPGTYRLNPEVFSVEYHPAVVIPAGFVGVVTNLFGEDVSGEASSTGTAPQATQPPAITAPPSGKDATNPPDANAPEAGDPRKKVEADTMTSITRPLAEPGERGTLRNVLQPGVYFINPKLQRVIPVEVGYNEYSQVKVSEAENNRISFSSETGYIIKIGVTVIWGIHPTHAAQIINEFGNIDGVLDKIISPQLRSICRNIGATYAARDFIQGARREEFQRELTAELKRVCGEKHVDVLLALVREVEVHAPDERGGEVTEDLKKTIQESFLAVEKQLTNEKQREAAIVKATLEEEKKKIDIARETIQADTRLMVADIQADGEKESAQVQARANLEAATIQQQVAEMDAKRTEILGQAAADVERFKKEAEAKGYKMLVDAFGSARAYNLYTFAENFQPQSIKLIFAGEGTFWTDLGKFEEVGAAKILQSAGTHPPEP